MRHLSQLVAIVSFGLAALAAGPAHAEKRVALVIGNGAYAKVGTLSNPARDAAAVEALLRKAGFDAVEVRTDLGAAAMRRALSDFSDRVADADIAVVFYAGHGIEVDGINYLIPVDATLERDIHVKDETIPLDRVTEIVEGAKRLRLVILDACRDNPFVRTMKRSGRSVGRGLARVDVASSDTLIAFAARHGSTAADGEAANSPYTAALIKHLPTPGLDLRLALGRVRDEVLKATGNRQEPFVYGSLGGAEIALVPAPKPAAVPPQPSATALEWARVDKTSAAELETFRRRHPSSPEAEYAAARIEELRKADDKKRQDEKKTAVLTPPPPPVVAPPKVVEPAVGVFSPSRAAVPLTATEERALKRGDTFKECNECPEMVVVPAGSFMMGSPAGEAGRTADEGPQHQVTIARPFAVGKFEVTFAEWDTCVTAGGCTYRPDDKGWGRGKRPAITVSWDDIIRQYLPWLSRRTGKTYRLLTEAEWEYAARAGTTMRYAFGSTIAKSQAQYSEGQPGSAGRTAEVGSFLPNAFGLYDTHGNVWEWVQDCWNESYSGSPSDGSAWTAGDCSRRVMRGGSWAANPQYLRSAVRHKRQPDRTDNNGFRVARAIDR